MYSLFPSGLEVVCHCAECGGEIYGGNDEYEAQEYFEFFKGEAVCEDCLEEYCRKHFLVREEDA